jgi:hypothetical protein
LFQVSDFKKLDGFLELSVLAISLPKGGAGKNVFLKNILYATNRGTPRNRGVKTKRP